MKSVRRPEPILALATAVVEGRSFAKRLLRGVDGRPLWRNAPLTWSRWLGWGIMFVGVLLAAWSLSGRPTLADVGLNFGTGLVLAGFVLLLERHLLNKVGEAFDESTAPMKERLEHLESLQDLQDRIIEDRAAADLLLVETVRERPTFETTAKLLERAQNQQLFGDLRLRGSTKRDTLISLTWQNFAGYLYDNYPDFDPTVLEENPHFNPHIEIRYAPAVTEGPSAASEWWPTQPLDEAWKSFLDACEEQGIPTDDINIRLVFESLASSYSAMVSARRSPPDDPRRLQGNLILLANAEWAITSAGLESRISKKCLQPDVDLEGGCPDGHDQQLWQEAAVYASLVGAD